MSDINYLNQIKKKTNEFDELKIKENHKNVQNTFFYYVYKGNYPYQIEQALLRRGVWKKFTILD